MIMFAFAINRPSAWQQFTDFANVLKAFIGTSYLSLPFAFYQSGLVVSQFKMSFNPFVTLMCGSKKKLDASRSSGERVIIRCIFFNHRLMLEPSAFQNSL